MQITGAARDERSRRRARPLSRLVSAIRIYAEGLLIKGEGTWMIFVQRRLATSAPGSLGGLGDNSRATAMGSIATVAVAVRGPQVGAPGGAPSSDALWIPPLVVPTRRRGPGR